VPVRAVNRLKEVRTALGLSQAELSKKSGVPVGTISRWEREVVSCYDAGVLGRLASALKVDPGLLFTLSRE
jgi:transcriptional regulator with XRE-family HTH domain